MTRQLTSRLEPRSVVAAIALLLLVLTACPPAESLPDGQAASDGGDQVDSAGARDGSSGADQFATDAGRDAARDATIYQAVPGTRCPLRQRVGLVRVSGSSGSYSASGQLFDRADPRLGDYALSDQACGYHVATSGLDCDSCDSDQVCSFDRICADAPLPVLNVDLALSASGQQQHFAADQVTGNFYGAITLAGDRFALHLTWADQVVTLAETAVPPELADLTGSLTGDYMSPTAVDVAWTPPVDGASVYTLVPINHHAGGLTFTECLVDASAGALHIDGAMLQPLAVATGLEFQGVQHSRIAAAVTATGCVEIRYELHHYLSLY